MEYTGAAKVFEFINKNKHIYVDDRELLVTDDGPVADPPIAKVVTTVVEEIKKEPEPEPEPKVEPIKITKFKIKGLRQRPKTEGKIKFSRRN